MKDRRWSLRPAIRNSLLCIVSLCVCLVPTAGSAQTPPAPSDAQALYRIIQSFELTGGTARVDNLTLKRDRAQMTFTGSFYFAAPANGRVTGAVFVGVGTFRADVPPSRFEQDNLRRLLHADVVESDFKTAVLRFSDDTFDIIGKNAAPGQPPPDALKLASEFEERARRETGASIAARLAVSLLNDERPGVFVAEFDKGRRNRFTCLLDFQTRILVAHFGLNGGEKGLIYTHKADYYSNDVWMAFYALDDYAKGTSSATRTRSTSSPWTTTPSTSTCETRRARSATPRAWISRRSPTRSAPCRSSSANPSRRKRTRG